MKKSPGQTAVEPITESDDAIAAALESADVRALMLAVAQITGDLSILRGDVQPQTGFMAQPDAGITPAQAAEVRAQALEVLKAWRDKPGTLAPPASADLGEMITFLIGDETIAANYEPFLRAEFGAAEEDPFAQPALFDIPETQRANYPVLIIGAGMSGLLAGIRLAEAGVPFTIIEKNPDVGGTWYENTYPGCRVDSANHVYSYSFHPKDWPQHFSPREVLQRYFAECADEYAIRPHIRFKTEVTEARFDTTSRTWRVTVRNQGQSETLTANAVISAVGQLNRPNLPDIPGCDTFDGPAFHSAQWQHDISLAGKKVGVIGTGASAFQFTPVIADEAAEVTLFQRTPPWIIPNPDYFKDVPDGVHWLLNHVPGYAKWFRFSMFWRSAEGLLEGVAVDEKWQVSERSVSPLNDQFRGMLIENLKSELGENPELLEKCTPTYPPGSKRALIDDGKWLRTLKRENVHLLTNPIEAITPKGVRTQDGTHHDFDVLIYATGFRASTFLFPMAIYGASGQELHDRWGVDPRAYKGITIPDFPNLYCCYGPNTNIVVNGSIVFFSESEMRYILGCLALSMAHDNAALNVREVVHDQYNEWIDAGNKRMAWGQSSVNTWYKNANGRITQNWPFSQVAFWEQSRAPDEADFEFV